MSVFRPIVVAMDFKVDQVLSICSELSRQSRKNAFLLDSTKFFINGDFVDVYEGVDHDKSEAGVFALRKLSTDRYRKDTCDSLAAQVDVTDDESYRDTGKNSFDGRGTAVNENEETRSTVSDTLSRSSFRHVGGRDAASHCILKDLSARKRNYVRVAGANDDRSTETLLVHFSGCFVISGLMDRIGTQAFTSNKYVSCALVVHNRNDSKEWLAIGCAVGISRDGSRTTIWRGCSLQDNDSKDSKGSNWFDFKKKKIDDSVSLCFKLPLDWVYKTFFGTTGGQESAAEFDIGVDRHYVVSAGSNVKTVSTFVTFELLNDINYINGTRLEVYAASDEEYHLCDSPDAFWSDEFCVATCEPSGRSSGVMGLNIQVETGRTYMIVPCCPLPLHYVARIASEHQLDIVDILQERSDSIESYDSLLE